jgi:single-stranded DNA-binding protein
MRQMALRASRFNSRSITRSQTLPRAYRPRRDTANPELKHTEGKKPVCIMGLATNRNWKGRKIYAEGRLQTRSYTGQDSVEKYATEVVLERMEMLDSMPQDVKETLNGTAAQQVQ